MFHDAKETFPHYILKECSKGITRTFEYLYLTEQKILS